MLLVAIVAAIALTLRGARTASTRTLGAQVRRAPADRVRIVKMPMR
jgi:hypothetical protein